MSSPPTQTRACEAPPGERTAYKSRYVVGWMIAPGESVPLVERLIKETCEIQQVDTGRLTIHVDLGSSMKSKPVARLLSDLGITKTHSRPYASDDNRSSEARQDSKYRVWG